MLLKLEIKKTWLFSYPIIIAQIGQTLMGFVDSLMIGHYGYVELGAAAIGNGFYMLILIIGFGISMAISPFVSESRAQNKHEKCGHILNQSIILNILIATFLTLLTYFASPLIYEFGQEKHVAKLAVSYTQLLSFGTIPFMVFLSYRSYNEGLSIIKPAMYITLLANIINFLVNWILIFGNLGAEKLGLDGAGYATFASRLFMLISIILFTYKSTILKEYLIRFKLRFDLSIMKRLIKVGTGSALQYMFELGCFIFAAIMIGWINSIELAAHQIAMNLASLSYMAALGVSMGASIRIAEQYGKKNKELIMLVAKSAWFLITVIMIVNALLLFIFNDKLVLLFNNNPEVILVAKVLIIVTAFFQISDGLQAVALGVLRGLSDIKVPTIITFISYWLIGIPVAYILGFYFSFNSYGVWIGLLTGLSSSALLLIYRFNLIYKKINF
jgi:multidrug resistance protein, MATE family